MLVIRVAYSRGGAYIRGGLYSRFDGISIIAISNFIVTFWTYTYLQSAPNSHILALQALKNPKPLGASSQLGPLSGVHSTPWTLALMQAFFGDAIHS